MSELEAVREEPLLFRALDDAVGWAGRWLVARGVRAGDVVALYAPDSIEFVVTRDTASPIAVTLSPLSARQEMFGQPGKQGARWMVTTETVPGARARSL
jgi:acyl-coenzyme A synthetase/AMP-(fatty) acid ligase